LTRSQADAGRVKEDTMTGDPEPVTRLDPDQPAYQPTRVPPRQPGPADAVPPSDATAPQPVMDAPHQPPTIVVRRQPEAGVAPEEPTAYRPTSGAVPPSGTVPPAGSEVVRYGPGVPGSQAGVPASQAGVTAESVWRTGHRPGPPPRQARLRRVRRAAGLALTVALLAVAGVVLWLRFFDHPPFHVTGVHITQQAKTACGENVTGQITTNGAAGTISYQWVFQPQTEAPQPLSQTVTAGQKAVYVTVAVQGQGHGNATQTVTLDVLGPDTGTASTQVTITC
jgi:hypothetical protein